MPSLGELGEFGLISQLAARLPAGPGTEVGIGDDAAVVAAPSGSVVAAVDLLLEGRHFLRSWSSAYDVGVKAAARSLADCAAMGAVPTALLVALAAPPGLPVSWARELTAGLAAECARVGIVLHRNRNAELTREIVNRRCAAPLRDGVEVLEFAGERIEWAGGTDADTGDGRVGFARRTAQHFGDECEGFGPRTDGLGRCLGTSENTTGIVNDADGCLGAADIHRADGIHVRRRPLSPSTT